MRTALLTLATLSTLAPLHPADACGSYVPEPQILQLSSHFTREGSRSFAVLGAAAEAPRTWKQLAPGTYDGARIARGTRFARPLTFTVVGRDGTRIVSSQNQVFLSWTFGFHGNARALELPVHGEFEVAIEGAHADATWIPIDEQVATTKPIRTWVLARMPAAMEEQISVSRVGDLQLVSAYDTQARQRITFVRRGDDELARRGGWALGIVAFDGAQRLVFRDEAMTSSLAI